MKIEENGKSATFLNPNLSDGLTVVAVDGCAVTEGERADFAVERCRKAIIVELKGRHIEKGAAQVAATASAWLNEFGRCDTVAGLIIARQYPRSNSRIQILQQNFAKKFGAPLHVVCCNAEFECDALFKFKNPLGKAK